MCFCLAALGLLYLEDIDDGEQAVLQCPLVVAVEDQRLQQLQDGQHIVEERQVVRLTQLLQVQVCAAVHQSSHHGQVPGWEEISSLTAQLLGVFSHSFTAFAQDAKRDALHLEIKKKT